MELMCSTKTDTFWQCMGKEILFGFSYLHLVMKGRFGLKTVKTFGLRVRVAIQYVQWNIFHTKAYWSEKN